jgi:hypothetical protein
LDNRPAAGLQTDPQAGRARTQVLDRRAARDGAHDAHIDVGKRAERGIELVEAQWNRPARRGRGDDLGLKDRRSGRHRNPPLSFVGTTSG